MVWKHIPAVQLWILALLLPVAFDQTSGDRVIRVFNECNVTLHIAAVASPQPALMNDTLELLPNSKRPLVFAAADNAKGGRLWARTGCLKTSLSRLVPPPTPAPAANSTVVPPPPALDPHFTAPPPPGAPLLPQGTASNVTLCTGKDLGACEQWPQYSHCLLYLNGTSDGYIPKDEASLDCLLACRCPALPTTPPAVSDGSLLPPPPVVNGSASVSPPPPPQVAGQVRSSNSSLSPLPPAVDGGGLPLLPRDFNASDITQCTGTDRGTCELWPLYSHCLLYLNGTSDGYTPGDKPSADCLIACRCPALPDCPQDAASNLCGVRPNFFHCLDGNATSYSLAPFKSATCSSQCYCNPWTNLKARLAGNDGAASTGLRSASGTGGTATGGRGFLGALAGGRFADLAASFGLGRLTDAIETRSMGGSSSNSSSSSSSSGWLGGGGLTPGLICTTGDCKGQAVCTAQNTGSPPYNAFHFDFSRAAVSGLDFYDISNNEGFNVPISVTPTAYTIPLTAPRGSCGALECSIDTAMCPPELQVASGDGRIACYSACTATASIVQRATYPILQQIYNGTTATNQSTFDLVCCSCGHTSQAALTANCSSEANAEKCSYGCSPDAAYPAALFSSGPPTRKICRAENQPLASTGQGYAQFFKKACPDAYSWAFDDASSIRVCSGASYDVTFCPAA